VAAALPFVFEVERLVDHEDLAGVSKREQVRWKLR